MLGTARKEMSRRDPTSGPGAMGVAELLREATIPGPQTQKDNCGRKLQGQVQVLLRSPWRLAKTGGRSVDSREGRSSPEKTPNGHWSWVVPLPHSFSFQGWTLGSGSLVSKEQQKGVSRVSQLSWKVLSLAPQCQVVRVTLSLPGLGLVVLVLLRTLLPLPWCL